MQKLAIQALQHKYQAEMADAEFVFQAIKALSAKEYAATTRAKRKATKKGKQVARQPKKIAKKTRAYRKVR